MLQLVCDTTIPPRSKRKIQSEQARAAKLNNEFDLATTETGASEPPGLPQPSTSGVSFSQLVDSGPSELHPGISEEFNEKSATAK